MSLGPPHRASYKNEYLKGTAMVSEKQKILNYSYYIYGKYLK